MQNMSTLSDFRVTTCAEERRDFVAPAIVLRCAAAVAALSRHSE